MPVKRRVAKRRIDIEAELKIWSDRLLHGHDWFGEVEEHMGLPHYFHLPLDERAAAEGLWRAAEEEAWARLGEHLLQSYDGQEMAYGEKLFGRPWEAFHAA